MWIQIAKPRIYVLKPTTAIYLDKWRTNKKNTKIIMIVWIILNEVLFTKLRVQYSRQLTSLRTPKQWQRTENEEQQHWRKTVSAWKKDVIVITWLALMSIFRVSINLFSLSIFVSLSIKTFSVHLFQSMLIFSVSFRAFIILPPQ